MYCPKCGSITVEGAEFCSKCGYKLPIDNELSAKNVEKSGSKSTSNPCFADSTESLKVIKGKNQLSQKRTIISLCVLIFILAGIAVLLVLCYFYPTILFGKTDYVKEIKKFKLYNDIDASIGQVLEKYIPDAEWTVKEEPTIPANPAYVDALGTESGDNMRIKITFMIRQEEKEGQKWWVLEIIYLSFNDEPTSKQFIDYYFRGLFEAYNQNLTDIKGLYGFVYGKSWADENKEWIDENRLSLQEEVNYSSDSDDTSTPVNTVTPTAKSVQDKSVLSKQEKKQYASDLIHHMFKKFYAETKKPIIAHIGSMGASGAYYAACGCNKIYALPISKCYY